MVERLRLFLRRRNYNEENRKNEKDIKRDPLCGDHGLSMNVMQNYIYEKITIIIMGIVGVF